jgi:hypothetical protein
LAPAVGFSGHGFPAHGLCRAAIGPCHGESQECHEGLDLGRDGQVSVFEIEAAPIVSCRLSTRVWVRRCWSARGGWPICGERDPTNYPPAISEHPKGNGVAGGGFKQAYNAQAAVPTGSLWWAPPKWSRRPMASSRSRRCWTSLPRFPRCWAAPRSCWRTALFQRGERRGLRDLPGDVRRHVVNPHGR